MREETMHSAENLAVSDMSASTQGQIKEKEKRERTKESIEKESNTSNTTRDSARAREELPPVIDVRTPPSLELLLAFAHLRCDFYDDAFTREWHRVMSEELFWCHPETGAPIRHWPAYFRVWRCNRAYFAALRDPKRLTEGPVRETRKADNWRGTRDEDVGDVLG